MKIQRVHARQFIAALPLVGLISCTLGLMLFAAPALAQTSYPSKPVKVIVSFAPGGTSDVMARMVADEPTKSLKQPLIVENVGGADCGSTSSPHWAARRTPPSSSLSTTAGSR